MKRSKKKAMIIAAVMIGVGLAVSLGAMISMGFDFAKMNTISFETKTYLIEESFADISIDEADWDVRLYHSEDGGCRVVCQESESVTCFIAVKDDTLHIEQHDNRKWYENIGVYWGTTEIAIYLPEKDYNSFAANNYGGNIVVPEDFCFESANIQSESGSIDMFASISGELSVKSAGGKIYIGQSNPQKLIAQAGSGDITIKNTKAGADMQLKAVSGDIKLSCVRSQAISAATASGGIVFSEVVADGSIHIESNSGNVKLKKSDSASLSIKTTSGSVSGTLLTEKRFLIDTTSGKVKVPQSASGGKCEVSTVSGNIDLRLSD